MEIKRTNKIIDRTRIASNVEIYTLPTYLNLQDIIENEKENI